MSWITYKGVTVADTASGDGGTYLSDDFRSLADRAAYTASSDPTTSDDNTLGFAPGSQWINTTSLQNWQCISAVTGAAVWTQVIQVANGSVDFNSKVGIGQSSPSANLHIKAGTASAGTGPLKLASGTLMTSPEAGAIEFDGTSLYYTDSTPTRHALGLSGAIVQSPTATAQNTVTVGSSAGIVSFTSVQTGTALLYNHIECYNNSALRFYVDAEGGVFGSRFITTPDQNYFAFGDLGGRYLCDYEGGVCWTPGGSHTTAVDTAIGRASAGTLAIGTNAGTGVTGVGNLQLGHLIGATPAPTIAAGSGAGTSPTVSVTGTDAAGKLSIATGTTPTASAAIATITFNAAFGSAPYVVLTPANAAAAALAGAMPYLTSTTSTFVLNAGATALAASTTYLWNYHVTG